MSRNIVLLLFLFLTCDTIHSQVPSWQFVNKMGTDKEYVDAGLQRRAFSVFDQMEDSHLNQYLLIATSGDTLYYDDRAYKIPMNKGASDMILVKLRCDGSMAWAKPISGYDPTELSNNFDFSAKMMFEKGDDENSIMISMLADYYDVFYVSDDTVLTKNNTGPMSSYAVFYDSSGVYQKTVHKNADSGYTFVDGYFPTTNNYFALISMDSITNIFGQQSAGQLYTKQYGTYLHGTYFCLLDSNLNYIKFTQIHGDCDKRINGNKQCIPRILSYANPDTKMLGTINDKAYYFFSNTLDTNSYLGLANFWQAWVIGNDTFTIDSGLSRQFVSFLFSYNDKGEHEFTQYLRWTGPDPRFSGATETNERINPRYIHLGSDNKFYFLKYSNTHYLWGSDTIFNPDNKYTHPPSNDTFTFTYGCADSFGNLEWYKHIYCVGGPLHEEGLIGLTPNNDIIFSRNLYGWPSDNDITRMKIGNSWYSNDNPILPDPNTYNSSPIIAKLNQHSEEVLYLADSNKRSLTITNIQTNALGDIYIQGYQALPGYIFAGDSMPIEYSNTYAGPGYDFFISKFGSSICHCDTVASSFIVVDSSTIGQITVKYTGTSVDSVRYLWGDGTEEFVSPDTATTTKTYSKDSTFTIKCIAYNSCHEGNISEYIFKVLCDTVESSFVVIDSTQPGKISVKYNGTPADSVIYLWGDGTNSTIQTDTLTTEKVYNKDTVVEIAAIVFNQCGTPDTFTQIVHSKCDTPLNQFEIITTIGKLVEVKFTGDNMLNDIEYLWGDGQSTQVFVPVTQSRSHSYFSNIGDSVKISSVVNNNCREADTFSIWHTFCEDQSQFTPLSICDSPYLLEASTDTSLIFMEWSDNTVQTSRYISDTGILAGIYRQKRDGCIFRDSFEFKKLTSPTIQKATKYLDCDRTPIVLDATNANVTHYQWSNSMTGATIQVNTSGVYTVAMTHPCGIFTDSFAVLDSNISTYDTIEKTVCVDYFWIDSTYSESGTYTRTFNTTGCDSVVTLVLKVGLKPEVSLTNGTNYKVEGEYSSYQWYLCDPWKKIRNETNSTFHTTTRGNYAVIVSNGECSDTSDCIALYSSSISHLNDKGIYFYPNPVKDKLTVELDRRYEDSRITITNTIGEKVYRSKENLSSKFFIDTENYASGTYMLTIESSSMDEIQHFKFIKE